jgi:hypothetical protein
MKRIILIFIMILVSLNGQEIIEYGEAQALELNVAKIKARANAKQLASQSKD